MDNDQRAQVGARIIAARGSQGLSQEELSSRAGITANTLRRIERGDKVHAGNLSAVCQALGITTGGFTAVLGLEDEQIASFSVDPTGSVTGELVSSGSTDSSSAKLSAKVTDVRRTDP